MMRRFCLGVLVLFIASAGCNKSRKVQKVEPVVEAALATTKPEDLIRLPKDTIASWTKAGVRYGYARFSDSGMLLDIIEENQVTYRVGNDWLPTFVITAPTIHMMARHEPANAAFQWHEGKFKEFIPPDADFILCIRGKLKGVDLKPLARFQHLRKLILQNSNGNDYPDDQVNELSAINSLTSLSIHQTAMTGVGLRHLTKLPELTLLEIGGDMPLTEEGLRQIGGLRHLKTIDFAGSPRIPERGLMSLPNLPEIRELKLAGTNFTDPKMKGLAHLMHLTKLDLSSTQITSTGLTEIAPLSELTHLEISNTAFNDDGMQHLSKFPLLSHLGVAHTRITGKSFNELQKLKMLRSLTVGGNTLSQEFIPLLGKLEHLTTLKTAGSQFTDANLHELRSLTKLQSLYLNSTSITVDGLKELTAFHDLRYLVITGTTGRSPEALQQLRRSLPNCRISTDVIGQQP